MNTRERRLNTTPFLKRKPLSRAQIKNEIKVDVREKFSFKVPQKTSRKQFGYFTFAKSTKTLVSLFFGIFCCF